MTAAARPSAGDRSAGTGQHMVGLSGCQIGCGVVDFFGGLVKRVLSGG